MDKTSRNQQILDMMGRATLAQIADQFGISKQRVSQIIHRHGLSAKDFRLPGAPPRARLTELERFMRNVDTSGECWEWRAARYPTGYGNVNRASGKIYAHRLAWQLATGEVVPEGMFVCHHCDNPPCVRPSHLFLGTPRDNVHDSIRKGRRPRAKPRVRHFSHVSDVERQEVIRRLSEGETQAAVARDMGRSLATVQTIMRRYRAGLREVA